MRKLKVSTLALSVMAGGVIAASAFYDVVGKDYPLNGEFLLPTNIVTVSGMPRISGTDLIFGFPGNPLNGPGQIVTDGAGKISGVQYLTLYLAGLENQTNNYLSLITEVNGKVSTKGSGPAVQMKLKGNGYSVSGNQTYGTGPTLNLNFQSQSALVTVPGQTLTYTNETETFPDVFEIVYTVKFFDDPTVYTRTNAVDDPPSVDNPPYSELAGTVSGTYKTSSKTPIKLNKAPALVSGITTYWTLDAGGNFVEILRGNGGIKAFKLDDFVEGQVINPGKKLYAASDYWSGKGTTSTKKVPGTYNLKLKGFGETAKSSLKLSGNLGDLIVDYVAITNAPEIVMPYFTNTAGTVYYITNTDSGITEYYNSWGSLAITNPVYQTNITLGIKTIANASGKVIGQKINKAQGVNVGAKFVETIHPAVYVPQPVEAGFEAIPTITDVQTPVDFFSLSTGDQRTYAWDFGDGLGTSAAQDPSYTYPIANVYSVSLTVTNANSSDTATKIDYITVNPVADFNYATAPAFAVDFFDASLGGGLAGLTTWNWNFGDGTTSNQQNPTHTFSGAGPWTVTLYVTKVSATVNLTSMVTSQLVTAAP